MEDVAGENSSLYHRNGLDGERILFLCSVNSLRHVDADVESHNHDWGSVLVVIWIMTKNMRTAV